MVKLRLVNQELALTLFRNVIDNILFTRNERSSSYTKENMVAFVNYAIYDARRDYLRPYFPNLLASQIMILMGRATIPQTDVRN